MRRDKRQAAFRSGGTAVSVVTAAAVLASVGAATWASDGTGRQPASDRCDQPGPYELPHTDEPVDLDPADLSTDIDNPYWPMPVGARWVLRETDAQDGRLRVEVVVTDRTRMIRSIEARVVRDVVTENGQLVEKTFDWYAQDSGGSIWYLGEFTREYEDGEVVSTEGSFEYGVDGAQAGVAVPAQPLAGCAYRQEYLEGVAEDRGRVLSVRDDVAVGGELYRNVLSTSDRVPLEPRVLEHKFYAEGVGPVLVVGVSPTEAREELVRVSGLHG